MTPPPAAARPAARQGTAAQRRAWVVGLLLAALVLAQALGFMHRVIHGTSAGAAAAQSASHDDGARHWSHALFAAHDSDNDCRLFDAANVAGAASTHAQALPLLLSSFFLACFQGDFVARWAALFDARGPPVFR